MPRFKPATAEEIERQLSRDGLPQWGQFGRFNVLHLGLGKYRVQGYDVTGSALEVATWINSQGQRTEPRDSSLREQVQRYRDEILKEGHSQDVELPLELRIFVAMTGNERLRIASESDANRERGTVPTLRACYAYLREVLATLDT